MTRAIAGISLLLITAGGASSQTTAALPSFDVASVKVSEPLPPGVVAFRVGNLPGAIDPARVDYKGVNLRSLISRAYGVKEYQVEGPEWLGSERYDVMAKIPNGESSSDKVNLMLQRLLAERFGLALHHESKPLNVYTLTVAKGGAKLKDTDPADVAAAAAQRAAIAAGAPPPPPPPPSPAGGNMSVPRGGLMMMMSGAGRHLRGSAKMSRLCDLLSSIVDRPVIDLTGLTGDYDVDLSWTPDENERLGGKLGPMMAAPPSRAAASGGEGNHVTEGAVDPGMNLAQALASYGLKLEAKRNPADILVIDHAEKVPTEN